MPKNAKTSAPTEVFKAGAIHANSICMTIQRIAPPDGALQQFSFPQHERNKLDEIEALPVQWRQGLLLIGYNKQPIDAAGRYLTNWLSSAAPGRANLIAAPAIGLRTGELTSTLCLDFDGPEAWATFRQLFGGQAKELLPPSITWTSGKLGRCQIAFHIDQTNFAVLSNRRRKIESLEFRWNGAQSVLMGHHPETKNYKWLEGRAPWEIELAKFPAELLAKIPSAERRAPVTRHVTSEERTGLVVPLEQFITLRNRFLIENGSAEGHCNDDSLALSLDLVGAETWVEAQGAAVLNSAQILFDHYCRQCPQTINGKPFNWQAMEDRFNGAVKRSPSPQTPENKLIDRLNYHRRIAQRIHQNEVAL